MRLDVLPHLESLSIQKIGAFGKIKTEIVPVSNI
jgi:hypothetical protein